MIRQMVADPLFMRGGERAGAEQGIAEIDFNSAGLREGRCSRDGQGGGPAARVCYVDLDAEVAIASVM